MGGVRVTYSFGRPSEQVIYVHAFAVGDDPIPGWETLVLLLAETSMLLRDEFWENAHQEDSGAELFCPRHHVQVGASMNSGRMRSALRRHPIGHRWTGRGRGPLLAARSRARNAARTRPTPSLVLILTLLLGWVAAIYAGLVWFMRRGDAD
jgi:hypothetical protein